uniref:LamG-like jellyroll fold domain-containing protein n=1 Tax=viral metagenome TaxID=1070528 RepID=A0A6C0K1V9_9ZZZZ
MNEEQPSAFQNVSGAASNAYSSVADSISGLKNSISSSMSEYSSPTSLGDASSDFLQSNSIIARIAFVLFVVILFNILLRLGMFLLNYFSQSNTNPYLIQGLIDGNKSIWVKQDPKDDNSVPLLRSNNKPSGIEWTWSVWLFVNDVGTPGASGSSPTVLTNNDRYHHIFHKGTNSYATNGVASLNNGPGVYLSYNQNPTIHIVLDTVVQIEPATMNIDNIPLKKWFHLLIRLQNNNIDVYMNGVISAHKILDNVPKQNYYDVFVCDHGGFNGSLSNLRYYASALNIFSINAIVSAGPNLSPSTSPAVGASNSAKAPKYGASYLSSLWYTSKL